jgi:hypothetical protein
MSTKANIIIEQGTTFNVPLTLNDINGNPLVVTSLTANAEMRRYYNAVNSTSFTTTLANGTLTLSMTAEATSNLYPGRYVYDVIVTDTTSNNISRIAEGVVTVKPSVTH